MKRKGSYTEADLEFGALMRLRKMLVYGHELEVVGSFFIVIVMVINVKVGGDDHGKGR